MKDNPQLTLRSLKGAPLSVLAALRQADGPLPQKALITWTGYSDKTVAAALALLAGMGAAQADGRLPDGRQTGWTLTPQGRQLWQTLTGSQEGTDETNAAVADAGAETAVPPTPAGRKFSGSSQPGRKFSVLAPSSSIEIQARQRSSQKKRPLAEAEKKPPVYYLLRQAGIGLSMSDYLSGLAWVSVPYAQAHLDKIRRDGDPLNYAIHRMREGDAPPACDCGHCAGCRERYLARTGLLDVVRR